MVEWRRPDDESWSIAGLPAARTFWTLFCSAYSPLPLGDKPDIDRFPNAFLIDAFTVLRQLYQRPSWLPPVPSGMPTPSLGPPSHQLCPSISWIIFLQPSHLPALSFLKFFKAPYLQLSTPSIIRRLRRSPLLGAEGPVLPPPN